MKKYVVHFLQEAEADLKDIFLYVAHNDSINKVIRLLDKIEDACEQLSLFPERGRCPPELRRVMVAIYREVFYKPYRIIYQILNQKVYIHCILDGRRNLEDYLIQRLVNS